MGRLANLNKLESLYLTDTKVTNLQPLENLSKLESLYCEGARVTDLSPLSKLGKLKYLQLDEKSVSDDQVTQLRKVLPNCEIFKN